MPVTDLNPEHEKYLPQWRRIQDVMDGEDAVRSRGETYLPKINVKQEDADYAAYNARACFFNGTKRTAEAMTGFIFRKPPTITTTMKKDFTEDVDMRGATLAGYCRKVTFAASSKGRAGTLIDFFTPPRGSEEKARPYLSFYAAEDILNWNVSRVRGRMALSLLVLREWVTDTDDDGFLLTAKQRWLVFRLTEVGVTRQTWSAQTPQDHPDKGGPVADPGAAPDGPPVPVTRQGTQLREIPFVFHNSDEPGACVSAPPLNDIATVNIHLFHASAELANARHACATPTPIAIGFKAGNQKLYVGSTHAWCSDEVGATAMYLEPQGNGLESLSEAQKECLQMMASLGARLIEPPSKDAEAFETVQLKASAETSTLARINILTSEGLSEVLQWVSWWDNPGVENREEFRDKEFVALNADYVSARLTFQELAALVAARQQDQISWETYFFNLQRGEMYPEGTKPEEELKLIKATPAMPPVSGLDENGNPIHGAPPPPPPDPPPPAK